jgi:hypothetical protein
LNRVRSSKKINFLIVFYLKNSYLILFNDTASIRKRSHDGVVFIKFNRNPNFIPDDMLHDFVVRQKIMETVFLVGWIYIKYYLFHNVIAVVKSTVFKLKTININIYIYIYIYIYILVIL